MKYDIINLEAITLIIFASVAACVLFATIGYVEHLQQQCVQVALKLDKPADDIRKICELR